MNSQSTHNPATPRIGSAVFIISLATLALEMLLLRSFSLRWSHHFAHLVIGTGMLGFGASGTLLSLLGARVRVPSTPLLVILAMGFAISTTALPLVSEVVGFEPIRLPVDLQLGALALHLGLVILPFLLAGLFVGASLTSAGDATPRIYFLSLVGSGAGALLATWGLVAFPPGLLMIAVGACGFLAALLLLGGGARVRGRGLVVVISVPLWLGIVLLNLPGLLAPGRGVGEYKHLSLTLGFPDARVTERSYGPLGRLQVVESSSIYYYPGLSMNREVDFPVQRELFNDGDRMGVVTQLTAGPEAVQFPAELLAALPYRLRDSGRALVLGAGAGLEILTALHHGHTVDAVEMNPQVIAVMTDGDTAEFSGHLYRHPRVRIIEAEARAHLRRSADRYDWVVLPSADAFGTSTVSAFAPGESPLYTVEAFHEYFDHLAPGGMLVLSRWIRRPAREGLRLIATAIEVLEQRGVREPERQLLIARDWSQLLILVKADPWTRDEIDTASGFLEERSFDWVWYPGIRLEEVNQHHWLAEPIYFIATRELCSDERERFLRRYPFAIAPVTDDRPFFFHTLERDSWPVLELELGGGQIPLGEWSELLLVWSAIQGLAFAFLFLIVPLGTVTAWRRWRGTAASFAPVEVRSLLFFAALGFGYLTIEISLLQRLTLFIGHPIHATALVLALLLSGSGVGSLVAGRSRAPGRTTRRALLGIVALALAQALALPALLAAVHGLPEVGRWCVAAATVLPLGFAMGYPFPLELRALARRAPETVPWAWGVNGFAAVLAAAAAALVALEWGFTVVALTGAGAYGLALFIHRAHRK